ncbi:MAG: protoporphyrinogen oxidase HemJ [Alphaproteobacteria bacterium]|nr:protoporphyrinogen oxidase HemJ [Alphaproteobacteria bacterium]
MSDIEIYDIIKILHIIGVISWMAGLLYLPRIYVYHCKVAIGSEADKIFQEMERKLLRFIMNPAMIATFLLGFYMAIQIGLQGSYWLHLKIFLVLILAGFHGALSKWRKNFASGKNTRSEKFYRIINEVPTLLMIVIVTLVILKP